MILRDIVADLIDHQPDMKIVSRDVDRSQLHAVVEDHEPDVVILGMEQTEVPEMCTELLDRFPTLIVVGVLQDGRRVAFQTSCKDSIGAEELVRAIRAFQVSITR